MRFSKVFAGTAALVVGFAARDVSACGACFAPSATPTVVSGHRMAMAISSEHTVLWDQIQYSGDPTDFAWVLPVKPGAVIEASTAAFFEVLEADTARTVSAPAQNCGGGGGFGCGATAQADSGGETPSTSNNVTVVHQGTVGPYDTVTLQSTTPGALNQWLVDHSYNVDPSSQPTIDAYEAEGFDFIAIRLQPGKDIREMTPVRVVSPAGSNTLPLRMVSIGAGATVPIVLYVIGEGRWEVASAPRDTLDTSNLSFDFKDNTSNYSTVRQIALAQNGGNGWLTTYADYGTFSGGYGLEASSGNGSNFYLDIWSSYATQAVKNGEAPSCQFINPDYNGNAKVVDPCPGMPLSAGQCNTPPGVGEIDVRKLECQGADDLGVALLGMHLQDVWISRLEANLPQAALSQDLTLQAAASQTLEPRNLQAKLLVNQDKACPSTVLFPLVRAPNEPPSSTLPFLLGGFLATAAAALTLRRQRASRAFTLPH